jgi:hypothetical protein
MTQKAEGGGRGHGRASGRGHGAGAKGGVEVGRRVRLPRGAERPIKVFINGVEQQQGTDYEIRGREIVFSEPIVKEGKLGAGRWLAMAIGLFGSYGRNETVDVEYRSGGEVKLVSDVKILPD